MLNVEYLEMTSKETKNLWFISTKNNWRAYSSSPSGFDVKMPTRGGIRKRIHNKYIKVSCPGGYYLKTPNIKGERIQYLTSSDDNYANKEFSVYYNRPTELYIKIDESIVDMTKDALLKKYILYVISNTNDKAYKLGLILTLEYKDNGQIGNPDFKIVTSLAVHKFDEKSIIFDTIDVTFLALLAYQVVLWICNKKIDFSNFGYLEVALVISYFSQLFFRTRYIENTILNKAWKMLKFLAYRVFTKKRVILRKNYFTEREFIKEIYTNSRESNY